MGLWAAYFLVKGYWDWRGSLRMGFWLNALLLAALVAPKPKSPALRRAWEAVLVLCGFLVFWRDSYLPPLMTALNFAGAKDGATLGFTARFFAGAINVPALLFSAALIGACVWAKRRGLRLGAVAGLVVCVVLVRELREPSGTQDQTLFHFLEAERGRVVKLPKAPAQPFDVVFLHICSLSWDDLDAIGDKDHALIKPLDLVYTGFNSVTGYSGPAALRLSRSLCGQSAHEDLYAPWPEECNLWTALRKSGYTLGVALNHQGLSRDFLLQLRKIAGLTEDVDFTDLEPRLRNFDEAPIYSDRELLLRWAAAREKTAGPTALYYNTVALHGGVHPPGDPGWWASDPVKAYRSQADHLAADLAEFYKALAASKRRTVVFLLPEHGMALRGSPLQARELRDIPLPPITRVPFGVKLVGGKAAAQARREEPVSYLAAAQLLASYLEKPPFDGSADREAPKTEFVAENEGGVIVTEGKGFYYKAKGGAWRLLP